MSAATPTYGLAGRTHERASRPCGRRPLASSRYIDPAANKEVAITTTAVVSPMTRIGRRLGPLWRQADARNPTGVAAADVEHELVVLSRHRTSEGVVTYTRCQCGDLQIWLAGAGRPAHTLITSIPEPNHHPP